MCTTSARPSTRRHTARTAPPDSTQPDSTLRVGDPEREHTAAHLGSAFTQGYLSMEEYETRLGQAFAAQTTGDLDRLTSDLPVNEISRHDPRRHAARLQAAQRGLRVHLISYVAMSLLLIGIWLAVALANDNWYFWPIWPILGVGIGVVGHKISVDRYRQTHWRQTHLLPGAAMEHGMGRPGTSSRVF